MSEKLMAHENENMFESSESKSFSSVFLKPLEDMISSPVVSDFFGRLKLNQKWLNGFKSNLQSLDRILGDAESKAYVNKQVKAWLDELNEVSYDLEDLLDEIFTEELYKPRNRKIRIQEIFSAKLGSLEKVIKRRLKEITEKIENLRSQGNKLGLHETSRIKREPCQLSVGRDRSKDESQVIGRDEDKKDILKMLLSDADRQTHVITMVGKRGVGKTTLAQLVYNDERVKEQFKFKAWIHVSKDFDDLLLTKAILHAFTYLSDAEDLDSLRNNLKYRLQWKKFLLVLDNLTMRPDWKNLQKALTAGEEGSRIIVTTCHPELQETMGTLPVFTVRSLTKEESWMLFAKHAFPDKDSSLHPKLEDIGKEILDKCGGLPLAVKILASVLRFKPEGEWLALLKNNSILKWDNEDPITSFLGLSYNDLPIHLKRCVDYCSIFPPDREYEEEKLILLWMAEGFLQQKEGTRMEEVGREYYRNLTYRSFFQPSGAYKSCFISNDLLKDLAPSESGFICDIMRNDGYFKVSRNTRHLLISGDKNLAEKCKAIGAAKFLRTLILYKPYWENESCQLSVELLDDLFTALQRLRVLSLSRYGITILPHSIGNLKYLRFLDLSYTVITKLHDGVSSLHNLQTLLLSYCYSLTILPHSIGNLKYLRFLDLSYTAITKLPNGVSSLHNLQTLLLSYCESLTKLPEDMGNLINLRNLDIRGTYLKEMPADMGCLTNLQDLSDFVVGKDSGSKIKELGALSNLQGTLHISHLENVVSAGDAFDAKLKNKNDLEKLMLEWSYDSVDSQHDTDVLEHLNPNQNLEELEIIFYGGTRFPSWLGDSSFFKMKFLCLDYCYNCSHLPPLGQLPSLTELNIGCIYGVKKVGKEFYGKNTSSDKPFPSLEILEIWEMREWEEWISPEVEGEVFPRLKRIRISQCYKLAKCSPLCLPPSAEVEIYECPLLRDPVTPVTDDLLLRDGNKLQFGSDDKVAGKPPIHPVMEDVQVPNSYMVQLKNEGEIPSQYLEHRTDVLSTSRSSPPESSILSTEMALPKLPVTVEKQLHEGNSREEKLLERPSTSRPSEVEELQLPDINVMQSTDVSITSSRPPPESSKHLTEDSSAKHEGALDTSSAATEIPSDTVTDYPINDEGDKAQFRIIDKLDSTSRLQEIEELQLPDSDVVWRTDVSITSSRPPPESYKHLTEDSSAKHEGALDTSSAATEIPSDTVTDNPINDEGDKAQFRRIENLDSTSSLQEIEELQLPGSDVVWRTDVSATSNSQPPESSKCLTEDSSAKHVRVSDNYSASTEISSDTDDPINDEGNKVQFRRNEKLLDIPSTSRLQETEELQLPDSNVVQSADVSVTSNRPLPESSKHKTEDSSVEHGGASDNSSASSDTDDPINVWYDEESLEDISSPEQESLNVSEISQLKRLPLKLYSLKIEECKALKSLPEELMHSNLRHLYIIDCQFLKSIQASHLPVPLKTLYIRNCKKLKFLSAEETMGKHTSVEHFCIESSCDPLKSFPLSLFPKLKNLTIWDCVNFNSISITEDHMSLNSLEIRDCTNLESLSKGGLRTPNLTSILLSNCKNLKQLPGQLHELKFLQSLFINECPELDSIPEGGLPSSLNLLRISSCHKLTPGLQWGLHQLNTFSRIEIEGGCRDLESFPEQNLLPRNLNSLQISRFPNLKILNYKGLQHLTSLQTLKINSCDKLQSLPEKGLPSSLSYLYISDCPLLKSKLHNNREDWYKIAHIPHIQIDEKVVSYVFGDLVPTTSLASFKANLYRYECRLKRKGPFPNDADGCKLLQ